MNFGVLILSSATAVYIKEHTVYDGSDRYDNDDKQQSRRWESAARVYYDIVMSDDSVTAMIKR